MNKLNDMINSMNYEDLKKIERDLNEGHISKLINTRLKKIDQNKKICPICYKDIMEGEEAFTLTFGPSDFKKKASFCALDCLEFFISQMREKEIKK
jgi:hypothetical protein